jgi:hypothetical protein
MTDITITIPNAKAAEVGDYIALSRGYTGFLRDGVTAETKAQFVRRMLIEALKDWAAVGKRIEAERGANEVVYRSSLDIT